MELAGVGANASNDPVPGRTPVRLDRGFWSRWLAWLVLLGLPSACRCDAPAPDAAPVASSVLLPTASTIAISPAATAVAETEPFEAPRVAVGSTLALATDERVLYVAAEDHKALFTAPLPLGSAPATRYDLPGAPAQLVVAGHRLFVTIRDPGLLLELHTDGVNLTEAARIELAPDAWGLTLTPDGQSALTSSPWSAKLSYVDLTTRSLRWSKSVARDPRGIVFTRGTRAYVSHLVSSALTRVDLDSGAIQSVALPAAPWRTAPGDELSASLGYALASDANGERVFAARHALGALGKNAWFGAASVDVLLTSSDRPLAPRAPSALPKLRSALAEQLISGADTDFSGSSLTPFTQPRALVVRRSTDTLLVAGEGDDRIAELDALAPDPTQATIHEYQVGTGYHPTFHVARQGAAPAGLALSQDEKSLYVYSRATNDVSLVQLLEPEAPDSSGRSPVAHLELAPDPLGPFGATGRKLFHSATDRTISGGLACAGCHPEGRDDGFVWREVTFTTEDGENKNFVGSARNIPPEAHTSGSARRTPLLAERVGGAGPYGWHAESPTLVDRELQGFRLHRWGGQPEHEQQTVDTAANAIADYLRRGLVPPPSVPIPSSGPIAEQIAEGRRIFNSRETGCADCHLATTGYSIWQAMPLAVLAPPTGFDPDPDQNFKVPSLRHLAGRAPYLHDGSAASLEELIRINANRMGKTSHLSSTEQSALVAFLQTL